MPGGHRAAPAPWGQVGRSELGRQRSLIPWGRGEGKRGRRQGRGWGMGGKLRQGPGRHDSGPDRGEEGSGPAPALPQFPPRAHRRAPVPSAAPARKEPPGGARTVPPAAAEGGRGAYHLLRRPTGCPAPPNCPRTVVARVPPRPARPAPALATHGTRSAPPPSTAPPPALTWFAPGRKQPRRGLCRCSRAPHFRGLRGPALARPLGWRTVRRR